MTDDSLAVDVILDRASKILKQSGSLSPRLDCELLLANVLSCTRLDLYKGKRRCLSIKEKIAFDKLFFRRKQSEPMAYLLGYKEFMGLRFLVSPDVLIPRPDTEILVEAVGRLLGDSPTASLSVLDVGTGSGCIAISLAQKYAHHQFTAWDISVKALEIAKQNACCLLAKEQRIVFEQVDGLKEQSWLNKKKRYHVIVSNPPYIGWHEKSDLEKDLEYEPQSALFAENQGLQFYLMFAKHAKHYLYEGGKLFLEVSPHLSQQVCEILRHHAWKKIIITKDYSGHERVISCEKKNC